MRAEQTALPVSAVVRPALVARLLRAGSEAWRLWRNRRAMRQLSELSDWELRDIGLERGDVEQAHRVPVLDDPTRHLQQIARANAEMAMR